MAFINAGRCAVPESVSSKGVNKYVPRPTPVPVTSFNSKHLQDVGMPVRDVSVCAQRGRPRGSSKTPRPPSPEAPGPVDIPELSDLPDATLASLAAPPEKKKRGRRSKTADVEGHEGLKVVDNQAEAIQHTFELSTAQHAAEEVVDIGVAREHNHTVPDAPLEFQQPEELLIASRTASGSTGSKGPVHAAVTPSGQVEEEAEDFGYGAGVDDLGMDDDGYEKSVLREYLDQDIYKMARDEEQAPEPDWLPRQFVPVTGSLREYTDIMFNRERIYWEERNRQRDRVHDQAFAVHHFARETGMNIYANTRRVAGLMSAFENDDYKLQNLAPSNVAPWARAELVFVEEHEEFNEMLESQMEVLVRRELKEAQEEELDLLDEALFLLRPDDDNAAAARAGQQSAEQQLLDDYLEGMLPGATLDNLAAAYADDIYTSEMDDYVDDELIAAATSKGKRDDDDDDEEKADEAP